MPMTPRTLHLAERASKEMDSGKLMHLIAELCRAIDSEREENRESQRGCLEDCREYKQGPHGVRISSGTRDRSEAAT